MNIYFLVEGNQTERRVYPKWLKHLVPRLDQKNLKQVEHNHYCLFSGNGYPFMLGDPLINAIDDVNRHGNFDYLVLCLDVDDVGTKRMEQRILSRLREIDEQLISTQLVIIFQNKCFETWFLGNRKIFKRNPSNQQLREYISHYNVLEDDPEKMTKPETFRDTTAIFHSVYFRLICAERKCYYSKDHPGLVTEKSFLDELVVRSQETTHIPSFGRFSGFANIFTAR